MGIGGRIPPLLEALARLLRRLLPGLTFLSGARASDVSKIAVSKIAWHRGLQLHIVNPHATATRGAKERVEIDVHFFDVSQGLGVHLHELIVGVKVVPSTLRLNFTDHQPLLAKSVV